MPTWKLNPDDMPLDAVLREIVRRLDIDVKTRRGQARVRAIEALMRSVAFNDVEIAVPHYHALEDNDHKVIYAVVEDWTASLRRMANEQRPPLYKRGNRK